MLNSNKALEMRGVSKHYGEHVVLKDVELDVPDGTVMGLLGKNGAGKTTLCKCALGLIRSCTGTIQTVGEPAAELSAHAKAKIGYVPQLSGLTIWMKVRHLIAYIASFYPHWNHKLMDGLVRDWGLDPEKRVTQLSHGQRQQLSIFLALGHEPRFLIFDEPAASLDPSARRRFLDAVLSVALEGGRSVLFSTHITSDIERVADQVAILKEGNFVFCGGIDLLKETVKRLRIRSVRNLPVDFSVPGMLRKEVEGPEALVSVKNANEELVAGIKKEWDASVESQELSLEDIFLELHHEE